MCPTRLTTRRIRLQPILNWATAKCNKCMSHSILGGLHRAGLISAEDKRATRNNTHHVTDAAENRRQSTHAFSDQGWHISSFKRQTCPGIKHTEWGLPHWATTKVSVHITQPRYISLLITRHRSEGYTWPCKGLVPLHASSHQGDKTCNLPCLCLVQISSE